MRLGARTSAVLFALVLWVLGGTLGASRLVSGPQGVPAYVLEEWTTREGLPQNMIRALARTRDGFLWIGTTNAGLVRFDGAEFVVFDIANTPALPSNGISALHEDPAGILWIGTYSGLATYRDGTFAAVGDESVRAGIAAVVSDAAGRTWVASDAHVARLDGDRWTTLYRRANDAGKITALLVDDAGTAWIGSESGLIIANDAGVAILPRAQGLPVVGIRTIFETSAGETLVGTDRGVVRLDRATRTLHPQPSPFGDAPVIRFVEDRDGTLWIASRGQFARRPRAGTTTVQMIADASTGGSLSAIIADDEGHLWLGIEGGHGGLFRLGQRLVTDLAEADGLPCDNIGAVTEGADQTLWLSTWCDDGRGLVAIRDGRMHLYEGPQLVSALLAESDGRVWAGTFGGLLYRLEGDRFVEDPVIVMTQPGTIAALHRDERGALWVGTSKGLFRHDESGQWRRVGESEGLSNHGIRTIVAGEAGTLWIGSDGGAHRYADGRFTNYGQPEWAGRSPVRAVHVDTRGRVWVGTYGSGLCRLADERLHCFGTQKGLLDPSVHRLIEDEDGYLWMSGDRGIRRVRRAELDAIADGRSTDLRVTILDDADGMRSAESNGMAQPAGWHVKDGTLRFPTQRGLVRVDPAAIGAREPSLLTPRVDHIRIDGTVHTATSTLSAPEGSSEIEFRYGAQSLARPGRTRFRYRLEGYDRDWVDAGAERVARYVNLAPGNYRFHVAARTSDGAWGDRVAIVEMSLPSGLTERLPVRIGLALLLLSAVIATTWQGWRAVQRRKERLAHAMAEQTLEIVRQQDEAIGAGYRLNSMKKDVERANSQVLAVLGQLDLGVLLLDPSGIVQHASESARRLLAPDEEAGRLEGRAWHECLSIVESDRARVRARIAAPLLTGERIPIQIAVGGRQYWMELDVREAPRPGDGCMLYLRDVTEISGSVGGERHEGLYGLLGRSSAMHLLYKQIRDVARVEATVLIEGETGSGKELVANAIHRASGRATRPFVAVNSAGFAEPLLASQLFGHRRGAFTGAVDDQIGLFEAANGGTLFLDEIGDVPLGVQASLLRVLQEREIVRLGDSHPTQLDVRFVAATHRNLAHEVEAGRFREDLLYRIRVATVQVPPLRERADDVPLLVDAFMADAAPLAGRPIPRVSHSAMDLLMRCRWPGNVRQLKSAVEQAVISGSGPILRVEDLPSEILNGGQTGSAGAEERARLIDALRRSNGNRNEAARLLGIGRATLYRKLAVHGIRAPH